MFNRAAEEAQDREWQFRPQSHTPAPWKAAVAPHHIDSDHRVTAALTKGGTNPTDLLGRMYQQMLSELESKQEPQQEDNAGTQQGPDAAPKPEAPV